MACTLIFAIDDFLSGRFSLKLHDSSNWHSTSIELLYDLRATQRALQEDRNARLLEVLILISYNRGVLLRHDWTGIILHFNSFILFTILLLSSKKVQIIAFFEKLSFSYLYLQSSWLERISGEPFVIFVVLRPLDITLFKRVCVDKRHDFLWPREFSYIFLLLWGGKRLCQCKLMRLLLHHLRATVWEISLGRRRLLTSL